MSTSLKNVWLLYFIFYIIPLCVGFSDVGKWDISMTGGKCQFNLAKSLAKGAQIFVMMHCNSAKPTNVTITYSQKTNICSPDYFHFYKKDHADCTDPGANETDLVSRDEVVKPCLHSIPLEGLSKVSKDESAQNAARNSVGAPMITQPLYTIQKDGIYEYEVTVRSSNNFNMTVHIEMLSAHGYLSAAIWPLLPFFGVMCGVYAILCTGWLLVCWTQWRDLLRIQFWIGGVALLGMLESATYYGVYASINRTGYFNAEAYIFAEWVSVAKRALARMLVIIVSLGFGIVKPRLGPALQRVVGTGLLWGLLAAIEAWLRLHHKQNDSNRDLLLSEAPLSLLDSAICWWVFVSLAHTMRTLQLRRNAIKLSLYRHFTNTLIFAVISSVIFMLYSIKTYRVLDCIKEWREVWVDEAYWHILFASVLTVIMVLWRPTNNNQRYAFTPLLDNADDDDDDEEEQFVNDSYGVKMRGTGTSSNAEAGSAEGGDDPTGATSSALDADLRWVEENIPSSTLPLLDSDEEIINTKFEVSKMQ